MFVKELYKYFEGRIFKELETEAVFLREAVKASGINFLSNINTDNRITIIDPDGSVIYDNRVSKDEIANLDNHKTRSEIIEAKTNGFSRSSRYSSTMLEKTLYVATKTKMNYIIRLSCKQNSVNAILIDHYRELILSFLTASVVSVILAYFISKKLWLPLQKKPDMNRLLHYF